MKLNTKETYTHLKNVYIGIAISYKKLQTEPELEFKSMHPMCDNLRPDSNPELIQKWINGETGFLP